MPSGLAPMNFSMAARGLLLYSRAAMPWSNATTTLLPDLLNKLFLESVIKYYSFTNSMLSLARIIAN